MEEVQASEWVARCSARLQQQWRTVDPAQLDEVAFELWSDARWRMFEPETAAVEWLRQGVLC
ncbi:MAG TPA: hypothetical protein VF169_09255 [Albitalea sp.]|uniref:hypothetical protein n=1 Tax=Piscinibacter sp. TaxID=1903157 RepID=UPI002ED2BF9E